MTSPADSSGDFVAILKELRAHAHACINNPSIGPYVPSAKVKVTYEQLRALPASNSDASDAIRQQIKSVATAGANKTANTLKSDIESALSAYVKQVQGGADEAVATFKLKMEASKVTAKANNDLAIDETYETAEALAAGMSEVLIESLELHVDAIFSQITQAIIGYIDGPAQDLPAGGSSAEQDKSFFFFSLGNLISAISAP